MRYCHRLLNCFFQFHIHLHGSNIFFYTNPCLLLPVIPVILQVATGLHWKLVLAALRSVSLSSHHLFISIGIQYASLVCNPFHNGRVWMPSALVQIFLEHIAQTPAHTNKRSIPLNDFFSSVALLSLLLFPFAHFLPVLQLGGRNTA